MNFLKFFKKEKHVCHFDLSKPKIIRTGVKRQDFFGIYEMTYYEYPCACSNVFKSDLFEELIGIVHYDFCYEGKKLELK